MSDTPEVRRNGSKVELHYNALLGRIDNTFVFVDKLFFDGESNISDGDGFQGATGSRMVPVTDDELDRRRENYRDPEWSPLRPIYNEQDPLASWDEWIDDQLRVEGDRLMYDPSYESRYGDTVRDRVKQELTYDDVAVVECIGGGRMFNTVDREFDEVYDDDLMRKVQDTESDGKPEWAETYV